MGTYRVVTPCAWLNEDGSASVHRKPGAVVNIPDHVAGELGAAVSALNTKGDAKPKQRPREPKTKPEPKPVEQQPDRPLTPLPVAPDASPPPPDAASASGQ